ncbi:MAG: hypothetical protein IKW01_02730 [Firmicutes bacterium]|nr:hypothetical protein [Bacillota bacterium]
MKNLIIIIGTILLGAIIVNTLVLGDDNSLKATAGSIMEEGNKAIMDSITFGNGNSGSGTENAGGI